jgi:heterodisulfide reductase subunit B
MLAVFRVLGIGLEELEDWNCCGATSYVSIDEVKAFALAARNLAIAERQGAAEGAPTTVLAPCAACYMVLLKTQRYLQDYPDVKADVDGRLRKAGLTYRGTVPVRHPLDIIVNEIGLRRIDDLVKRRLTGIHVASYYGCQIVRPFATFDHAFYPTTMDHIVTALGGEPVDWDLKTRCCGGTLTGTIPDAGLRLNRILLREAQRKGADIIITACPLCQFNLECYQKKINDTFGTSIDIPILFFTQLMGLAFGLSERELGISRLLKKPRLAPVLEEGERTAHA